MKLIKIFNKEIGNKMERQNKKTKVENIFDKIEDLKNREARLINEREIRIKRINFEIEETRKEILSQESELKLKLSDLDVVPGASTKPVTFDIKQK